MRIHLRDYTICPYIAKLCISQVVKKYKAVDELDLRQSYCFENFHAFSLTSSDMASHPFFNPEDQVFCYMNVETSGRILSDLLISGS